MTSILAWRVLLTNWSQASRSRGSAWRHPRGASLQRKQHTSATHIWRTRLPAWTLMELRTCLLMKLRVLFSARNR